ncbi:hypothetical protein [Rhizobium anhuiense]|uniref:hypothetical protein n=1 Tax=Rhizobium anhuiense TaxID=1184720 RepID=UPI0007B51C21|nr:hypothetical protein [Rhizobium anhuiense]KZS55263.1 hypothetical protein AS890_14730 [Rhizobium anhuiense bv. trifolii]
MMNFNSRFLERRNFASPNYAINKRGRTMSAATRQRRYRARRKAGRRVIMLEVDEIELSAVLEGLHFLSPMNADDDEAVQRALHDLLGVLCRAMADDA